MAKTVTIGSAAFKNIFLRLDGKGVTHPTGPGGGVVNAQFGAGSLQQFRLENQADGSVAIASVAFPGVYLRLDGRGITGPGNGGVVNAQFGVGPWEKFQLEPQDDGDFCFLSREFPNVYLRLDGTGITAPLPSGGGAVRVHRHRAVTKGQRRRFGRLFLIPVPLLHKAAAISE